MSAYARCRSCDAPLIWATTEAGKKMPLDRTPDPQGIVLAYQDTFGTWHCRAWTPGEHYHPPEQQYSSHFATCPNADQHRKPASTDSQRAAANDVVTYLHQYRKGATT